jgi:hypothetical protein
MKNSQIRHPARALLLVGGLLASQAVDSQASTGSFSGKFAPTDKITLRNVGTNFTREAKVKDNGTFWIRRLPVGTYEITIHHADGTEEKKLAAARIGVTTPIN